MASPAATVLQSLSGKPGANNYGGYNPFPAGANSANSNPSAANIGTQLQGQVQQDQANYSAQQDAARNQLYASLQASSVGGGSTGVAGNPQGNNGSTANSQNPSAASPNSPAANDPFAQFSSAIGGITQRGVDATGQAQGLADQAWTQRIQGMQSTYQQNISTPQNWDQNQISAMLGNLPTGANLDNPGAKAVAIAQAAMSRPGGLPYVWGGNSLSQGVDCSGLVQQVYGRLGIQLPRTSTQQAKFGKLVPSLAQALPGDLILEYSPYEPQGLQQYGHVGIYIGNGQVIEAPGTGKNVRIGPIVNMTRIVRPW